MADDVVVTSSGNRVHREAHIFGGKVVTVAGKTEIAKGVIIRGDLGPISIGRECLIGARSILRPPPVPPAAETAASYARLTVGSYVIIGEECLIEASWMGSSVILGDRVVVVRVDMLRPGQMLYGNKPQHLECFCDFRAGSAG